MPEAVIHNSPSPEEVLQRLYANIVLNSTDAIISVDNHNRIVTWNLGAEIIFGYRREEAVGQPLELIIPPELQEVREVEMIQKMTEHDGYLRNYETERMARGNRRVSINLSQTPLYDDKGEKIGAAIIIKDISGRKGLEKSLRKKIEQLGSLNEIESLLNRDLGLQRILKAVLVGVTSEYGLRFNRAFLLLVDNEGKSLRGEMAIGASSSDEAHRIWAELHARRASLHDTLQSLEAAQERRDRTANEIVSRFRIPLEQRDHLLVQALETRQPVCVRSERDCPDRNLIQTLGTAAFVVVPLILRDKKIGVLIADNLITGNPITQEDIDILQIFANHAAIAINDSWMVEELRHGVEALRLANQNLKINQEKLLAAEKLSTIGEMAAKVAHEIRNPLATIGGFARAILADINQSEAAKAATKTEYLKIIIEEVMRLEEILTRLLDYARPISLNLGEIPFQPLLENVLTLVEADIERAKIRLERLFPQEDVVLISDKQLLLHILFNLFKNAVQAMEAKGAGVLTISYARDGDFLRVGVRDTGIGMSAEIQKKIFRPFFTTKEGGSGLGLAILSQAIAKLGGQISVISEVGVGSEFVVRLPLRPKEG